MCSEQSNTATRTNFFSSLRSTQLHHRPCHHNHRHHFQPTHPSYPGWSHRIFHKKMSITYWKLRKAIHLYNLYENSMHFPCSTVLAYSDFSEAAKERGINVSKTLSLATAEIQTATLGNNVLLCACVWTERREEWILQLSLDSPHLKWYW